MATPFFMKTAISIDPRTGCLRDLRSPSFSHYCRLARFRQLRTQATLKLNLTKMLALDEFHYIEDGMFITRSSQVRRR